MKKYFSIPMGSRGEIEIPYITESSDIKGLIKVSKDGLIKDLKDGGYSKKEINEYLDEWFCTEDYDYGSDVVLGEEQSCVYIDIESDLFKNWGGDIDSSEEKVWDLLNGFWNGGNM